MSNIIELFDDNFAFLDHNASQKQSHLTYWKQYLADAPRVLDLPTDRPRASIQSHYVSEHTHVLSKQLTTALRAFSLQASVPLHTTLIAALQTLLYRYTGQNDFLLGTTNTTLQDGSDQKERMSNCLNILLLRANISGDPTFCELLKRVQDDLILTHQHDDISLKDIVDALRPEQISDYASLIQVMFSYQLSSDISSSEPITSYIDIHNRHDLHLEIIDQPEGLIGHFLYNTDLFDATTINRIAGHWQTVLEGIIADSAQHVTELPLLTEEEKNLLLVQWNDTASNYPQEQCIHQLFEAQVERTPDAMAIVFENTSLTYHQLNGRANQLARYLRSLGVGPDVLVGICMERSLEMVIGILGILKAGGAYVPLDVTYPAERLAFMLEDAQAPVVLTQRRLMNVLPAHEANSVYLDSDWDIIAQEDEENLVCNVQPTHLAYVIYTSGSTGKPKGVMIPHQGLVNYLSWCTQAYAVAEGQGTLVHSPLGFDLTVTSLFSPLLVGKKAILLPEGKGVEALHVALHNNSDISLVKITPAHLKLLSQVLSVEDAEKANALIIGGEALLGEDISFWRTHAPTTRLINEYGPTETVVGCCVYEVPSDASRSGPISIGRPIANTKLYVLDTRLQPVPINVPGELYIGGAGVARGYLNRPDLTTERFIADPFSTYKDARMYRTGDLVRYRADGNIEFLGRLDSQVKIRGFRIELGEIEALLELHPAVQKAVVMAREDSSRDKRLVAYVLLREGQTITEEDIQAYIAKQVPGYMVPSAVVVLDAFPLTSNGKIDRRALPEPSSATVRRSKPFIAPRTPNEECIAQIWAKVLSVPAISVDDDFFMLGGHSLLAVQVIAQLRTLLQVELPLHRFFEAPMVAQLAEYVEQHQQETEHASPLLPAIQVTPRDSYRSPEEVITTPASLNQQSLWLVDQMESQSAAYNLPTLLRLHASLDMSALQQSLNALVERHETLRTNFALLNERLMQVIAPTMSVSPTEVDLQELPQAQCNDELQRLIVQEVRHRFDLAHGPLLRATVFHLGPQEHVLLLVLHHIISDGWSVGVLYQDFAALYDAFTSGQPATLVALPIHYADFALWQREPWQQERMREQLDYWKQHLAGVPPVLDLPGDHPRPAISTHKGKMYSFMLSAATTQRLKSFSRQEGTTLYIALMTAFKALLYRYTGQEDLVIGTVTAGRSQQETHDLIGYFVNTLALRTDLSGDPSVRELLKRVRETVLGAQAHQEVGFEEVVREVRSERSLSFAPLVQVLLTLDPPLPDINSPWQLTSVPVDTGNAKFDLALALAERSEGMLGMVEYSTDLFEEATIARMMRHWQTLLEAMLTDPNQVLSALPLLRQEEQQHLVAQGNASSETLAPAANLSQLIEEQVARTPDAIALRFEEQTLTYQEVNARANQLAHHLVQLGVGPDIMVGVCVERSPYMLISLLAILKAGGVYVPMDSTYPHERLAFILDDTHMPVLLTQQHLVDMFAEHSVQLVCLDADAELLGQQSVENLEREVTEEQIAYVIYTSGSTGHPKGVLVSQTALAAHCQVMVDAFELRATDRVLQFSAITFDPSLEQMLTPLLVGAQIVLRGPDIWSPAELLSKVNAYGLTVVSLTPAYWHQVAQAWANVSPEELPTTLRLLASGGDKVVPDTLHFWRQTGLRSVRLLNAYGPTEATITVATYDIDCWSETSHTETSIPIGRALPQRALYVLDRARHLVPIGVIGELYIGGPLLARGYLNRPELTAERFVPDPFSTQADTRMYRTGDLVRYRADGTIEFVGRADAQVKIRGFRVELGEIEAVLNQHPAMQHAIVLAREDVVNDKRLVAYVLIREGHVVTQTEIQAYVATHIPSYMVPAAVVVLDAFPLNTSGKVDQRALPAPDYTTARRSESFIAPRTLTEERITRIWAKVLSVPAISVDDDFFLLGGHSLLAVQVIAQLRTALQVEIPLRNFFETPTVAQLAEYVEQHQHNTEHASLLLPMIQATPREQYRSSVASTLTAQREELADEVVLIPASLNQQSLWLVDQMESESVAYNLPTLLHLHASLTMPALQQSLQALVERHETLRTNFALLNERLMQVIAPTTQISPIVVDLQELSEEQRDAELQRLIVQEVRHRFDLAHGPLLRATVFHLGPQEHVLLLVLHHIISDGWSVGVLYQDFAALYDAFTSGQPATLAALPIHYADFALWQREPWQQERMREQLDYWKQHLAGVPPVLDLPGDHPRPAISTHKGKIYNFVLPTSTTQRLKQFSRQEGVTLYIALMTAFKALLYRYTEQEDLVIGTVTAGRSQQETHNLIGYFVNTLALRTDLSGDPSVRELLGRVRETVLGAQAHQEIGFEEVVREVRAERSLSFAPLIQVLLTLDPPLPDIDSPWKLTSMPLETGAAKFDLALELAERSEGMLGTVEYNTDLFEEATIARMMRHWQTLLEAMLTDPNQVLSALPLLRQEEQQQLLVEYNSSATLSLQGGNLPQLIEEQVARTPDAPALVFEDQTFTYHEVNAQANQLARHLTQLGVGPDVMVGVCVERSPYMLISLLAILKAGGVYVPMDPTYPDERLAFILDDTHMPVLLTQQHLAKRFVKQHIQYVCLDSKENTIREHSEDNLALEVTEEQVAYVIYTSGSTGHPKGVLVSHAALAAHCQAMVDVFELRATDRVLQFSAITFDPSLEQMLPTLLVGARIVLRGPDIWSPAELLSKVNTYGLTVINFTPAYWHQVAQAWANVSPEELPTTLRLLISGGDKVMPDTLHFWQQTGLHSVRVLNAYGPTEATIAATIYEIDCWSEDTRTASNIPIGRALPQRALYILDHSRHLVPMGIVGELYIGGPLLARGYLNRPELTTERFVSDPFSANPEARMYRTGDLVRYRADGNIEFVGRADAQVKIRGFRIELGEIEAVLSQHPAVQHTVVLAREDTAYDKRLVAYVQRRDGYVVTEEEMQAYVAKQVPGYMVPSAVIALDVFPLTSNGKVDRRALPAPDYTTARRSKPFVAPRTTTEQTLAQVWANALGVAEISVDDDFFMLGGHSLLAVQVIAQLRTALQVEISLRNFFETPTVAQLAQYIEQQQGSEHSLLLSPAIQSTPRDPYRSADGVVLIPASLNQQSLWLVDQMDTESAAYNLPTILRLHASLDMPALQQSLNALVERHETLRTNFALLNERLMQVIASTMNIALSVQDLQDLSEEQRETELQRLIVQEVRHRFDLAHGPLLRATVFHLGPQEHVLLLVLHHIVSDGWSVGVLYQDFAALYDAFTSGQPATLVALPIHYADFALWQREPWQQERMREQLDYWKQHLAGVPPILELPGDHPRPAISTHKGSTYSFMLSTAITQQLRQFSKQEGTTLYIALMTAFKALLYRYTEQEDLVIGTVIAGRSQQETHNLIGYFVNTLALRTDLSGDPTIRDMLKRVRETVLGAQAHQEVGFEELVKAVRPERSLSFAPLVQVLFSLDIQQPGIDSPWKLTSMSLETDTSKFDLTLGLAEHSAGLLGMVEYNTDLFEEATIARMMRHWQTLLEAMLANPDQTLSALPLLGQEEQQHLVMQWNASSEPLASPANLTQLIEEQVTRTPDAPALVFEDQTFTYHEVNVRANQLARHLAQLGVGPDVMVGVCVERSPYMLISLLAILKAGGVYVPMDPTYPRERLAFILDDTHMSVLLTQQHLVAQFSEQNIQLVRLDADAEMLNHYSTENLICEVTREQVAYVIYTSGSTGQPKGVLVSYAALTAHCYIMIDTFELQATDRVLQFSAITFDPSLEQMLTPLLVGAQIVLRGPDIWSPAELLSKVNAYGLTFINLTPAYWHQVAQAWANVPHEELPTTLRLLASGGDKVMPDMLHFWRQTGLRSVRLLNAYGPTEATITVATYDIDCWSENSQSETSIPIGRALPQRALYVLDRARHLVPVGVIGELYIGGPLLARGYLNRPELTAERFVPDPFSTQADAQMYRTGDLVRYRADGTIEFVGRADAQVKIRGFRIELGEIEAVLNQHEDVSKVVVVAREDASGDKALISYVVPTQGRTLEVVALRRYLKERLPEYMVPAAFVSMDTLPLLPTGKINLRALPAPDMKKFTEEEGFVAPKLFLHQQLAQIWEELLNVRPIGIKDNFFYLGGHSLLAARLVDRIEHVFGKRIALSTLFSGPTIEQLAEALQQQQGHTDTRASLLPVQVGGSKRPLFFLHGDWTGGAFYCFALARALGPDQPFYVLEPYKFGGLYTLPSFKDVAAAHIKAMRAVQPQGPYLLGGFCNGGLFAYEMARQLEEAGERVDFLGLINPSAPVQFESVREANRRFGKLLLFNERQQTNLLIRVRHALRHIYKWLRPSGERVQDFGQLLTIEPRLGAMFPSLDALYNDYVAAFAGIMLRYETGMYSGKITFYWASEEPNIEDTWNPVTQAKNSEDIENIVISGTHMSCVTDHIQELAQCFSNSVRQVQEDVVPEREYVSTRF